MVIDCKLFGHQSEFQTTGAFDNSISQSYSHRQLQHHHHHHQVFIPTTTMLVSSAFIMSLVLHNNTHVPISSHWCFAPQWQVSWLLNVIQAPDKQTVLLLFLSHTRNSTDSESKEFHVTYSAKASTYIFFHRTEIALTNPQHRSSHSGRRCGCCKPA